MNAGAAVLDRAGIAARIPHAGAMCLLDRCHRFSADDIACGSTSHRDEANPLRMAGVLPAAAAIEYAAQAMALHGALAAAPGKPPAAGFLASVRGVRLAVPRLDDVAGEITVAARRLAGDGGQALYAFTLHDDGGRLLAAGRAAVVLDALP